MPVLRLVQLPAQAWLLAVGAGGLFVLSENGSGAMITRVDPAGGQAGPSRRVTGAAHMAGGARKPALGGDPGWVVRPAPPRGAPPLLALSPAPLAGAPPGLRARPPRSGGELSRP